MLHEVLHDYGIFPKELCGAFANRILNKGKSFSANSRGVYVSNDKIEKKVIKMKLAGRSDTSVFAQTLSLVRQQFKHRGIKLIRVGDKDWLSLKEVCKMATEFCNEFGLHVNKGYKEYIQLGMKMMKNFSVFKFKSLHSSICNQYEAIQKIAQDKTPEITKQCHLIYLGLISEKTGYAQGYEDNPEKYQYFVQAKEEAKKYGVSQKVYFKAQFDGLEWVNAIPDPAQLVGAKAIERLQKYAFTHKIRIGEKTGGINFKRIRTNGKNHN